MPEPAELIYVRALRGRRWHRIPFTQHHDPWARARCGFAPSRHGRWQRLTFSIRPEWRPTCPRCHTDERGR